MIFHLISVEVDSKIFSTARTEPQISKVRQKARDLRIEGQGQLPQYQYYLGLTAVSPVYWLSPIQTSRQQRKK